MGCPRPRVSMRTGAKMGAGLGAARLKPTSAPARWRVESRTCHEAHATEQGLVRVVQSQIAMTPRGSSTYLAAERASLDGRDADVRADLRPTARSVGQLEGRSAPHHVPCERLAGHV